MSAKTYLPELYYLQDQPGFPFKRALSVTAHVVSRWCQCYYAHLIAPVQRAENRTRAGRLPQSLEERASLVESLLDWIFSYSEIQDLFTLFLDVEPLPETGRAAKFDHHDDTCCWVLSLTEEEFKELQAAWKTNDLPEDLFYPEDAGGICVPVQGDDLRGRIAQLFGVKRCYTPKQWEAVQETQESLT